MDPDAVSLELPVAGRVVGFGGIRHREARHAAAAAVAGGETHRHRAPLALDELPCSPADRDGHGRLRPGQRAASSDIGRSSVRGCEVSIYVFPYTGRPASTMAPAGLLSCGLLTLRNRHDDAPGPERSSPAAAPGRRPPADRRCRDIP